VLEVEAEQAFYSIPFLCIEEQSLLEILRSDRLNLSEVWLVIAVVHWGQFQLQVEGRDPKLEKILSKEEQLAIFMSVILRDFNLMPPGFLKSKKGHDTSSQHLLVYTMPYFKPMGMEKIAAGVLETVSISFKVDKMNKEFVGLRFVTTENFCKWHHFSFEVLDYENDLTIGKGDLFGGKTEFGGREYFKFSSKCLLSANTTYVLLFKYQSGKTEDFSSTVFDCQMCGYLSCTTLGQEHRLWPCGVPPGVTKMFDVKSFVMLMRPILKN
jgi:hypothetical protein